MTNRPRSQPCEGQAERVACQVQKHGQHAHIVEHSIVDRLLTNAQRHHNTSSHGVTPHGSDDLESRASKEESTGQGALLAGKSLTRDPVSPPSEESGGIPNPSDDYLFHARQASLTRPSLQHILVVMDLNGTLLYRPDRRQPQQFRMRPSSRQFLHYMLCNFEVMVWSSARPENVRSMCRQLFTPQQKEQLLAVWGRDRFGLCQADYVKHTQVYKRLQTVWSVAAIQNWGPTETGWNQYNTILLDDSVEKGRAEPYNLVQVPEFGDTPEDANILQKVAQYLDLVKFQSNVSAFMRSKPFKLDDV
jgi:hypothetical protein